MLASPLSLAVGAGKGVAQRLPDAGHGNLGQPDARSVGVPAASPDYKRERTEVADRGESRVLFSLSLSLALSLSVGRESSDQSPQGGVDQKWGWESNCPRFQNRRLDRIHRHRRHRFTT